MGSISRLPIIVVKHMGVEGLGFRGVRVCGLTVYHTYGQIGPLVGGHGLGFWVSEFQVQCLGRTIVNSRQVHFNTLVLSLIVVIHDYRKYVTLHPAASKSGMLLENFPCSRGS